MSKYTKDQLQNMALDVIDAAGKGDQRADMLVYMLSAATNMQVEKCVENITKLADGKDI